MNTNGPQQPTAMERLATTLERLEAPVTKLASEMARERHSAGIWSLFKRGGLVLMFLLGLCVWLAFYGSAFGVKLAVLKPTVAQVEIVGDIGPGHSASANLLVPLLQNLCSQSKVRGLVLHIDSPGGSPGDAERIGAAIDACKTMPVNKNHPNAPRGKRRVVAVIDGLGASAAYMIAIHADQIVANPTGLVGSIGVIIEGLKYNGLMKKVGISAFAYASGPLKTMLSPFLQDTPAQKAVAQELTEQGLQVFKADVIAHRPHLVLNTPDLWSGRVWIASQAKAMGLIDQIGLLEPTEAREFPKLTVQVFRPERNVRDLLSLKSWVTAIRDEFVDQALADQAMPIRLK